MMKRRRIGKGIVCIQLKKDANERISRSREKG